MFYLNLFRLKEGDILGLRYKNSIIITGNYMQFAIFFTLTTLSLIHKYLRYPQKCNIFFRLSRQVTCLTNILGKLPRTHGQKNYALSSNLEGCP